MRIECPHCHAVFEVPEALAKGVKRLRCSNCGDSWELMAPAVTKPEETQERPAVARDVFDVLKEESEIPAVIAESPTSGAEGTFRVTDVMAGRNSARRSTVLHSRSAGEVRMPADAAGPLLIGSKGAWVAAWGASLVLAGSGVAALWYCKGAGAFGFLPGVGHFS